MGDKPRGYPARLDENGSGLYPNVLAPPMTPLQAVLAEQSRRMDTDPPRAHACAAVAGVGLAFTLAAARSVVFASTVPPSERAFAFLFCLRGATPVYAVPLVIGLQYDCWRTRSERRERALGLRSRGEGFSAHDAADMG